MSWRSRGQGQGGFTLVEMLLSITLLALVLASFGGLLYRLQKTGAAIAALEAAEDVAIVRRFVAASLGGSRAMLRPAAAGRRLIHFSGLPHQVTFASVASGEREVGGLYETTFMLNEDGQLLMLRRPLGWAGGAPLTRKVLLRGVASMALDYDPCPTQVGGPGLPRWNGQDHLPYRITMTLAFAAGDDRTWPELSVFPGASACPFR